MSGYDENEVNSILTAYDNGETLSSKQKKYLNFTVIPVYQGQIKQMAEKLRKENKATDVKKKAETKLLKLKEQLKILQDAAKGK